MPPKLRKRLLLWKKYGRNHRCPFLVVPSRKIEGDSWFTLFFSFFPKGNLDSQAEETFRWILKSSLMVFFSSGVGRWELQESFGLVP